MTVGLMVLIFYIGYILTSPQSETSSPVAPQQTKAEVQTTSKFVALNANSSSPTPVPTFLAAAPTLTPTATPTPSPTGKPTPGSNEIVIAQTSSPVSVTPSVSPAASPTSVASLPETGYFANAAALFGMASLLIFFSFLY